jgi:rod shape-determining protein MreC
LKRRSTAKTIARTLPFPIGAHLPSVVLIILSLGMMIFSALRPQAFDPVRSAVADFVSPVLSGVSYPFQKVSGFLRDVTGLAQLQADNARLSQENQKLREWYHTALLLESENKSLRDLLNVKIDPEYTHVSARVIADSGSTFVKSILVMAGTKDGVEKGQAVISGEGLVGRIIEAGEETSRVLLVTDINSRVPVVVEDTLQNAIMSGTNDYRPQMIHMPQDSEIAEGARIVTSAYGAAYPQGLPVGKIVMGKAGEKLVHLFADTNSMQIVRILKMKEDPNLRRAGPSSEVAE